MKKIIPLVILVVLSISCEDNLPVTITATTAVEESIPIVVPQTSGTAHQTDITYDEDLGNIIANLNDVESIDITNLSYQFKNINGNSGAVIQNAQISMNGISLVTLTNVNISQEATNGTVYSITDETVLNQLESLVFNNSTVSISYRSTTLSEAGAVTFDLEVSLELTATLN